MGFELSSGFRTILNGKKVKSYKGTTLGTLDMKWLKGETLTWKADAGYVFTSDPISLTTFTSAEKKYFTVNESRTEATLLIDTDEGLGTITVATAVPFNTLTMNTNLITKINGAYAKAYKNGVQVTSSTVFYQGDSIVFKSNAGYRFPVNGVSFGIFDNAQKVYATLNEDRTEATVLMDQATYYGYFEIVGEKAPHYIVKQSDMDLFALKGVQMLCDGVPLYTGMELVIGNLITAIPDDEHEFYDDWEFKEKTYLSVGFNHINANYIIPFVRDPENPRQAYKSVSETMYNFYVDTAFKPADGVRGFNNIHLVSQDELRSITQSRFVMEYTEYTVDSVVTKTSVEVDYGKYMLGLIELPFTVDPAVIQGYQTVKLGSYNTGIDAQLLNVDYITVDMGSITVPATNQNFTDYINTTAILHLPYVESINLDIEYVIDQTITIEYRINLYDGVARVSVYSTKIDGVVAEKNVDLGITIPYANIESTPSKNDPRNIDLGGKNSVSSPYIEILRNDPLMVDSLFNISVTDENNLADLKGFIKVEEIELKCRATSSEKDLIVTLLNNGVIIK